MSKVIQNEAYIRSRPKVSEDKLANAVEAMLVPQGASVTRKKKSGGPTVIEGGIAVAEEIGLENRFDNAGVEMVRRDAIQIDVVTLSNKGQRKG